MPAEVIKTTDYMGHLFCLLSDLKGKWGDSKHDHYKIQSGAARLEGQSANRELSLLP